MQFNNSFFIVKETKIPVPALGESITEATVAKWHFLAGDSIKADDLIVELETDKVTLEVYAPHDGVLVSINKPDGETVTTDDFLGVVSESMSNNTSSTAHEDNMSAVSEQTLSDKPMEPKASAADHSLNVLQKDTPLDEKSLQTSDVANFSPRNINANAKEFLSSHATSVNNQSLLNNVPSSNPVSPGREELRVPMSRLRQKIAERLKSAQDTAAILTTFNEVDMTAVMDLRQQFKTVFEKKHGVKLGFMSFFIKATVAALKAQPIVNSCIDNKEIVTKTFYDISIAVSTPNGLVVPVLRNADQLSMAGIEQEIITLGTKGRDGKLTADDMSGGTFTITNGGTFGSLLSTPILNPPQSAILGMHKIQERPMAINGQVVIRPMMYLALSYDHRLIDGKEAVTFLVMIKSYLENPGRFLLDIDN